jgi:hypothetical protein
MHEFNQSFTNAFAAGGFPGAVSKTSMKKHSRVRAWPEPSYARTLSISMDQV